MTGPEGTEIGDIIAGRYRVERVLGQGGMGIVVQAMHLQLEQRVAIKFLRPTVAGTGQAAQRFLREAQAAVRLKSEHVARVIDVGTLDSGAPYIVLEFLEGTDLASVPRAQLSVGGIVDLLLQACEALAEAHSLGIVHRDVKPANFFITRGAGSARLLKVLDFGISKAPTANGPLTMAQTVMGTPAYMSPEQMRSARDVDPRTDIWALGVALYELLEGSLPFAGTSFSVLINRVLHEPPAPLTVALPDGLAEIVYRCLDKDPAHRFQNVAELAQALAKYAQSDTQAALSVHRTRDVLGFGPPPAPTDPPVEVIDLLESATTVAHAAPSTLSSSVGTRTTARPGGRRWPIAVGIAATMVAGFAIASVISSSGAASDTAQPTGSVIPLTPPAGPAPAAVIEPTPASPAPAVVGEGSAAAAVPDEPSNAAPEAEPASPGSTTAAAAAPAPPSPVARKSTRSSKGKDRTTKSKSSTPKPLSYDDPILGTRN